MRAPDFRDPEAQRAAAEKVQAGQSVTFDEMLAYLGWRIIHGGIPTEQEMVEEGEQ